MKWTWKPYKPCAYKTPKRYTSSVDRDALILAELREIKALLKLIKDRM